MPPEDDLDAAIDQEMARRNRTRTRVAPTLSRENLGEPDFSDVRSGASSTTDESIIDKLLHLVGAGKKGGASASAQAQTLRGNP